MRKELPTTYDPADVEDRLYRQWEERGYFHAEVEEDKPPYTIVIPPPNITGQLHMGHALDNTLQDILIRWRRMQGYNTLWQPGTDHASIATEVKIVAAMAEEGLTKEDLGREGFLERAWKWKEEYGGRIIKQLKKLGSSCDWERERFTMDEGLSRAVLEVFIRLYEKGLIYKGSRIINWCPECQTSISDAEVEHEEQQGHFWHIRYPYADGSGYIEVATTRPETMLGDTAVAVHPEDPRYADAIGKNVILPLVDKEIPVIADAYVDREFGTGAVKITPAHDPNDFEVGLRHNLEQICILTDDGHINEKGGRYAGMERYEARKAIVQDLEDQGYLLYVEPHSHNVGTHDRCHSVIEPMVKQQWFVKMEELAKPAIEVLKKGELTFIPERFGKVYLHWLENIRDWCISRQLWWGHRIPAYYCTKCGHMVVDRTMPEGPCEACGGTEWVQDEDTLDTWFSSALWPFSTLGWPDDTPEFRHFYPTSVLVTGYDIIFFWVVRMVFSGLEHTGECPFQDVFIHGIVRDSQGRKMSKSLGNGIDPLEVIDKYGADALRFTLVTGNAPGNDMRFYWEKVEASRNFANKIWNASRFILMNMDEEPTATLDELTAADRWILSKVNRLTKDVTENMEKYELGIAVAKLNDFFWEEFCDWYIEMVKSRLYNREDSTRPAALWTLRTVLLNALKLLHPYMPFITEELFSYVCPEEETIMLSSWPEYREDWDFSSEEEEIEIMKEAIRGIRNIRAQMNVSPKHKAMAVIVTSDGRTADIFQRGTGFFAPLSYTSEVVVQRDRTGVPESAVSIPLEKAVVYIPLDQLVDLAKEKARLEKERDSLSKELERVAKKLSNQGFLAKAPQAVVEEERVKEEKYKALMRQIEEQITRIGK
ncbi:valine--tRNA ligase [Bianquea renquensis]|nr:valine--tRNA ligase [Bianquea renquensis]